MYSVILITKRTFKHPQTVVGKDSWLNEGSINLSSFIVSWRSYICRVRVTHGRTWTEWCVCRRCASLVFIFNLQLVPAAYSRKTIEESLLNELLKNYFWKTEKWSYLVRNTPFVFMTLSFSILYFVFETLPLPCRTSMRPSSSLAARRTHTQFRTYKIILSGNGSFPLTHQNKEQCLLVNLR